MDNKLVGKTINKVLMDEENEYLMFETNDGVFIYQAQNDCCNSVWFNHIDNVDALIDAQVFEVHGTRYDEWTDLENKDSFECKYPDDYEEMAFWTFKTSKGHCKIEVRNNHNGYYGGDVKYIDFKPINVDFKEFKEDF